MDQKKMLRLYHGRLAASRVYEKFRIVEARVAEAEEVITTITPSGYEAISTAQPGDYIVRQSAMEQYVLPPKKFLTRHILIASGYPWAKYQPIGKIRAFRYYGPSMWFEAPWGEKMVLHDGDMLASPLDLSEIYRIDQKSFKATYRPEPSAGEVYGGPLNGDIRH